MAVRVKVSFVCSECGASYPKWQGQCTVCKEWNTLKEEVERPSLPKGGSVVERITGYKPSVARPLHSIEASEEARWDLLDGEFNRVLGGGLVRGSFTLLGGEPGIGKSTLLLQTMLRLQTLRILYVSGEESEQQLKMRADRLNSEKSNCLIYCSTSIEEILATAQEVHPDLLVIDSIQTVATSSSESSPGTPSQIKECANLLLQYAKTQGVSIIVVGHITKDGSIAGPKVLEHTVDTVLQFEGDKHFLYRILRASKNRFGSTTKSGFTRCVTRD